MEKVNKSKYTVPSLTKLGYISIKTRGSNQYEWDHASHASATCQDNTSKPDDSCHQAYYS